MSWQDECPSPNHIKTFTGLWVDPFNLKVSDIDIQDIAHSLARQCRFNGHCDRFVSVAEHSLWVSRLTETPCKCSEARCSGCAKIKLWALLHDAGEAYIGDIPRPIKHRLAGFIQAEEGILKLIGKKFRLPWPMPMVVKEADNQILDQEFFIYMGGENRGTPQDCTPMSIAHEFLEEFYRLGGRQGAVHD